jgi:hypothetical protein
MTKSNLFEESTKVFEGVIGRLISGALWGLGAGLVLAFTGEGGEGLRPLTKSAMKAYLAASDRVREFSGEARESIEDIYAEARTEKVDGETAAGSTDESKPASRRRRRPA